VIRGVLDKRAVRRLLSNLRRDEAFARSCFVRYDSKPTIPDTGRHAELRGRTIAAIRAVQIAERWARRYCPEALVKPPTARMRR
jgi:hypothetical protein